jgi:UDP-N-acetylglucosamine--N-acetylmuramyl-(pentapeptide) pyrophosphoryl-undecaprenol N-acetylglucosamine transferase
MIGYYIHHSGNGHRSRAYSICAQLKQPVTALTSLPLTNSHPFSEVVPLPRDDAAGGAPSDETANGTLHWAPLDNPGLRARMRIIADWVDAVHPAVVVVDVSVEVATLVRLLGVPVVTMAMPGRRIDAPHTSVYRLADHILAGWPRDLYEPAWLRPHRDKTSYVGGISRFDGRPRYEAWGSGRNVAVLGGDAKGIDIATVRQWRRDLPEYRWHAVGVAGTDWVDDPWPQLCAADVVVSHAGESSIAEIASAARPAIIIPQRRPFDEQFVTASVLSNAGLAVTSAPGPPPARWPQLLDRARNLDAQRWSRWQTRGAAHRAAVAIERVAERNHVTVSAA